MSRAEGTWGEAEVANYLRRRGYTLLAHGFHCRFGEIDLIVADRHFLVFVEVKLRKTADFAAAREFVDRRKQDRLRITASIYLSENPTTLQPRFDVIELYAPAGVQTAHPEITHIEEAFQ